MNYVSYLFSPIPGPMFNYATSVYIFAIILIVVAIGFKFVLNAKKKNRAFIKTFSSLPSEFIWMGIVTIILNGSRTSAIPYLSMRFLLYFILALSVFYILYNLYRLIKVYPKMKLKYESKKSKKKVKKYSTGK